MKESKDIAETPGAVSSGATEAPITGAIEASGAEQNAVPAATPGEGAVEQTQEYVVTVNAATGDILRMEKLDHTGVRTELTADEYASMFSAISQAAGSTAEAAYAPLGAYSSGYAQGVFDYQAALTAQGQSPEVAAYNQAVVDYQAAVDAANAQSAYNSSLETAYAQGMTDYQAAVEAANAQSAYNSSLEAAYTQGMTDYQAALTDAATAQASASSAYYQGMQDCHNALAQAAAPAAQTAEEAAYYQGVADYQAGLAQSAGTTPGS